LEASPSRHFDENVPVLVQNALGRNTFHRTFK
jgi:hypothetical protein